MWEKFKEKVKALRSAEAGGIDIGNILMLGIGMIFIAVGLIIYPVTLEGITTVLEHGSLDSYSGLEPVAKVVPLIVLIGFVSAGVITGFFGIKNIVKG